MPSMRTAPVIAALSAVVNLSVACAADVSINGTVVVKAASTVEATQDITEFRSGGEAASAASPAACGART